MTETPAQEWPAGDGEMARLVRAHDWSNTPLGSIDVWLQSLRSAAGIVLGSPMAMILLWGPELIQIYNDAYRTVMGRKHPAGLGQPTRACWPEIWDFTGPICEVVFRGQARSFKNQKLALERDGIAEDAWFDLTYSPVRDEAGAVSGVLATVVETTGRRRADEALRESEAQFRALVTAGAYAVYHMSPDWTEMRGLHGKGFMSDTRSPRRSWLEEYVHPDDRDRVLAAVGEAIRAKDIFELEHRVSRTDGTVGWTFSRAVPLLNEAGEITEWFGAASDITARKRAEEALRESEEGFRAVANLVPDLLWSNDPSGATAWYNDRFLDYTGQSLQEARGDGWLEIIHPDDRAHSLANYQAAVEEGRPLVQQHRVRRRDGKYRWFLIRAEPVRDEAGRIARWFGAATDIHDMRKLQDEQKVLVAELQHRTRNLLAVVQSVMRQTIRASASLEEFDRRFAGRLAALGRAQEMLARADGEPVTIQELAHTELAAHGAEPDGERVSLDGPPVELPRRGLETLALAVHELATNAVKYGALSLPAGRLTIVWTLSVERDGESRLLTLEWRETGVEMPDPDIGKRGRGFGQELIERALPYQLNAETELEFTPEGVRCRILMPLH